ncbi:Cyclophilin type peptidyl-prolyl cis-trans isomerase/CLD [Seminavis robusta]|uniref:Cyclophilin type peptidyl-prolyl cis-trans isomerase/CLD n=1 Tax=Seminavis robusta TaxID=568900 RepID=A0A9N8E6U7_9STRA|nr:Cyclophilin type peptidyl-prolyl cis-trans isomerase/CLD [Seminavis robusta]|eukprot:Sro575_g169410.1 Cyclophilin type peptidyl-prolyl cis-trans isomerase/CLD (286) ;mRNA; r:52704-53561
MATSEGVIRRSNAASKKPDSKWSPGDETKRRRKKRKKTQFDGQLIILVLFVVLMVGVYGTRYLLSSSTDDPVTKEAPMERRVVEEEEKEETQKKPALRQESQQQESTTADRTDEKLALTTDLGTIIIHMRPELSQGSVDYLHRVVEEGCKTCRFYRCEPEGILQGIMDMKNPRYNTELGPCPKGSENVPNDCPEWDKHCGCHGPVMKRGMVAWAAGQAGGPDFFLSNYREPATWWGTQHTNFGEILPEDTESFAVIDKIFKLPSKDEQGLTFINKPVHFTLSWME